MRKGEKRRERRGEEEGGKLKEKVNRLERRGGGEEGKLKGTDEERRGKEGGGRKLS